MLDPIATCEYVDGAKSLYFKFTPSIDGLLIIDTRGSVYTDDLYFVDGIALDSVVSVFTGSCSSLAQVFCADQNFEETVYYTIDAGVTYTIKIDRKSTRLNSSHVD